MGCEETNHSHDGQQSPHKILSVKADTTQVVELLRSSPLIRLRPGPRPWRRESSSRLPVQDRHQSSRQDPPQAARRDTGLQGGNRPGIQDAQTRR